MVDIQTVSIAIASSSIVVAVVYYILQLQYQKKMKETDLIMRTQPMFSISYKDWREYMQHMPMDHKDYDDFVKKYGSLQSGKPEPEAVLFLISYFEMLGVLVKRKLLSLDIVYQFYGMYASILPRILMPIVEGLRKEWNVKEFVNGEYVLNEMKKRKREGDRNG